MGMEAYAKNLAALVELLPQKPPFRFVDEILEASPTALRAAYRFREDEYFYQGHFPGNPVTPGVILVEAMAQAGLSALALFRLLDQGEDISRVSGMPMLFTLADAVEFTGVVRPGERVVTQAELVHFRKKNMRSAVAMTRENGEPVARGVLSGTGAW